MRAEDELEALVAGLAGAGRQHLVQEGHLVVTYAADTGQRVFDQAQDLAVDHELFRRGGVGRLQRAPLGAVVGEQQEQRLRVPLTLDVLLQASQTRLDERVLAGWVQLHAAAEHHGDVLLVEL